MYLRFIHILSCSCSASIFTVTWYVIVWLYHTIFLHSTVNRTIMKNATINVLVCVILQSTGACVSIRCHLAVVLLIRVDVSLRLFGFCQFLRSGFTSLLFHQQFLSFHILAYHFLISGKIYECVVVAHVVFIWISLISYEGTPF